MSTVVNLVVFLFIFYACDANTLKFDFNETFGNYRYELHETFLTYNLSKEYCKNKNGTLAMFKDGALEKIAEKVKDDPYEATFFIGGTCSSNGTCTWNDGSIINFTNLQSSCPKCDPTLTQAPYIPKNCHWTGGSFLMVRFQQDEKKCVIKSRELSSKYERWFMCRTKLSSQTTTNLPETSKSLSTLASTEIKSSTTTTEQRTTPIQTTLKQTTKAQTTTSSITTSNSDNSTNISTTSSYANITSSKFPSKPTFTNASSTQDPFTSMSSSATSTIATVASGLLSATTNSLTKDCREQDICEVSFPPIKHGFRGYSNQTCEEGSPKAIGICHDGNLTCIHVNCSKTINELFKGNITSENVENIFSSLSIKTYQTASNVETAYDVTKYIAESITKLLKTNQTISTKAISFILDAATNACKNLNDKNDEKSLKSKLELALNLPKLSDLSETENLKVESSGYSMKANILSGENFSFGEDAENSLEVNLNKEAFKHGERASVLFDKKSCLNPVPYENESKIYQVVSVSVKGSVARNNVTLVTIVDKTQNNNKETIPNRDRFHIVKDFQCVYYHEITNQWKHDGMESIPTESSVTCKSTHFTNFALLVSTSVLPKDDALNIAGKIACSLSIVCLFGTILFNLRNRQVRKRRQTILMINISSNLLLVYVLFVAGISQTHNRTACTAVAICLHYFMLTSWMWMAVYSYDLYFSLVVVFERHASHFLKKSFCVSYGVPLILVSINSSLSLTKLTTIDDGYYLSPNMCWLKGHSLHFGLLLPIGILLLFNFIMYILVMRSITCGSTETLANGEKRSSKEGVVLGTAFALTTGLSWAFAYFMMFSQNQNYLKIMSWLFTITTGLQGMLIFILTCVRHKSFKHSIMVAWNFLISSCGRSERRRLHLKLESATFSTNTATMSTTTT